MSSPISSIEKSYLEWIRTQTQLAFYFKCVELLKNHCFLFQAAVIAPTTYVRPKLHPVGTSQNRINLVQCRHPCVEIQDGVSFIPNDVLLEKEKHNFIIVTGVAVSGSNFMF